MVLSSFMNDVYSEKRVFRCTPKNNDDFPMCIYLFKVNNRDSRTRIIKLKIIKFKIKNKDIEQRQ